MSDLVLRDRWSSGRGGPSLFGREAELAALTSLAERGGRGAFVFVEGDAGIGKTSLLEAACERLRGLGVRVLWACGRELEHEFGFGVVRQLFERVLAGASAAERERLLAGPAALAEVAIGRGLEAGEPRPRPDSLFLVVHALYWLTVGLAESEPVVLVIDDAHWADAESLRFLDYVAARLEGLSAGLVLAARPAGEEAAAGAGELVARLRGRPGARLVGLGPLGAAETAAIVRERLGADPDPGLVAACLRASGGNPLLLGELIAALRADRVVPDASAARLVAGLGPRTVARSLFLRLSRLPGPVGPVCEAVAVLDAHAEVRHVAAVSGLAVAEVERAADALAAANVLDPGRPLRFVHPVVREAVYRELAAGARATLHAAAARALSAEAQPPARVAAHLLLAEPVGDPAVVELLRRAAAAAAGQGALGLAQRLLERALAEPPTGGARADVLAELGVVEAAAARELERASAHLDEAAAATADRARRAARVEIAARARRYLGDLAGAAARLERERAHAGGPVALRLLAQEAALGLLAPPLARAAVAELEHHTRLPGDGVGEPAVLAELAGKRWLAGRIGEAAGFARRALAGDRLLDEEGPASVALNHALAVLIDGDRFGLATPPLERALARAREQGSLMGVISLTGLRTVAAWRRGALGEVEALVGDMLALGQASDATVYDPAVWALLADVLLERGELEAAEGAIARSGVGPQLPKLTSLVEPFAVRARLRLARARPHEALEDLLELRSREHELGVRHMRVPWRRDAVRACLALGRQGLAHELAAEQLELTRRWDIPSARGIALCTMALATCGAEALELFEHGARLLARSPARLDHARALVDLGAALRRAGSRADAREPLREALDSALACGATVLAAHAREELAAAGARPRRQRLSGAQALTASERRVATMAAKGASNRDIAAALYITVRTAENHLSHAYHKLGIGSRAALARALDNGS